MEQADLYLCILYLKVLPIKKVIAWNCECCLNMNFCNADIPD